MESKNIKIIDEHGIDRTANIVCSIDVDGSDYVVYWIERDNDNDNLFISKLLKNNDGTSTMMNIEDSIEKSNLNDVVKELITHAINDEKDSIDTESVTLKNGKNVKIANVLFNKEQKINVQKTYITTVKKSVTKVSEKYYHVENTLKVAAEPVLEENKKVSEVSPVEMPNIDEVPQPEVNVSPVSIPEVPVLEVPVQSESVPLPVEEVKKDIVQPTPVPVIPEAPLVTVPEVEIPAVVPEKAEPSVDPRMNILAPAPEPELESKPETPAVQSPEPVLETVASQVAPVVESPVMEVPTPSVVAQPAQPVQSVPQPSSSANNVSSELFFDGSKETNLAGVFDGGDDTKPIVATDTVVPIREFGQDEPVIPIVNDVEPVVTEQPKTLTRSPGFANNKFFMVIALTFFVAACVFLGYEVFKYFQMR